MSRNNEKKRVVALENDPLAYRREAPRGSFQVSDLDSFTCDQRVTVVGRLMLSDRTGVISRFGVFHVLEGVDVIILERLESNGSSVPVYLLRTLENIKAIGVVIHYGDVVALTGTKSVIMGEHVFIGDEISLISKAVGDVYDTNIDFRKRLNLYTHRHLQIIKDPDLLSHFRNCSLVLRSMREFLYNQGYDEINMTLLQESFEGGLADPFVTHTIEKNRNMYLRVTSEMMLRKLMIAGFSKIFEIGKSFRNQGATSTTHPQFTILELYCSFTSSDDIEMLLQKMICHLLEQLYGSCLIPTDSGFIDCSGNWPCIDFREEVEGGSGIRYDETLSEEELAVVLDRMNISRPSQLTKLNIATALYSHIISTLNGPVFLRNLPAIQSPLFKINDDGFTVDETLLVINKMLVADIVNPERDPRVMNKRMQDQLKYRKDGDSFGINQDMIDAMKFGLPPCRGIGMGIERLLMLLLNKKHIRDVEIFPVF